MTQQQPEQRSPEWFEARKGRITGSVVGAILEQAPYMTRDDALRSMVRSYHKAASEFSGNVATEYATANEDTAIACYEMESGNNVDKAYFVTYEDWLGASPDGYIGDDGLLETKCPYGKRKDVSPEFKTMADQPHYYSQIQTQLLCIGRKFCDFWQWSAYGHKLERVYVDQQWLDTYMPQLRQFYSLYLSELDNPEHLEPLRAEVNTPEMRMKLDELEQLREAIDNATERKKEVEAGIIAMCNGKNALAFGRKITKVERAGSVAYAKLVKDKLPDVDVEPYRGKSSEFWKIG